MASREPLTELATVKADLGITGSAQDDFLDRQIARASFMFTKLARREFHRVDGHTEDISSKGGNYLYVEDRPPILTINSIKLRQPSSGTFDTVDAGDYRIEDAESGKIVHLSEHGWVNTGPAAWTMSGWRNSRQTGERLYRIDYDGGYVTPKQDTDGTFTGVTLPPDIEEAIIDFCAMALTQKGHDQTIESKKLGDGSVKWRDMGGQRVPVSFANAVQRHRNNRELFA